MSRLHGLREVGLLQRLGGGLLVEVDHDDVLVGKNITHECEGAGWGVQEAAGSTRTHCSRPGQDSTEHKYLTQPRGRHGLLNTIDITTNINSLPLLGLVPSQS